MLTLIVPMAGSAERFGGTFKPFLRVGDEYFIEATMRPFRDVIDQIGQTVFIIRRDHDDEFGVHQELTKKFADFSPTIVVLDEPTSGPVQTVRQAVVSLGLTGDAVVCDCDHSLDVSGLLERFRSKKDDEAVLPVWTIASDEAHGWCVAEVDDESSVVALSEKSWPIRREHTILGVIGCYVVKHIERLSSSPDMNFSEMLSTLIQDGKQIGTVVPKWAEFYGDPARLEKAEKNREKMNRERGMRR